MDNISMTCSRDKLPGEVQSWDAERARIASWLAVAERLYSAKISLYT